MKCLSCRRSIDGAALQLGPVPISNRFASQLDGARVELDLVMCDACRLVQLRKPPGPADLMPRVPWIKYNEPDAHLDDLVDRVLLPACQAHANGSGLKAIGLGPFEAPLLARLARRGAAIHAPDLVQCSRLAGYPYVETWQDRLDRKVLGAVSAELGLADLVSCRYVLEHCRDPLRALSALSGLLRPEGLLVIEVPDSSKFLRACDYAFPWEEHVSYFVEETLISMAAHEGLALVAFRRYPGRLEDALVGIFRASPTARVPVSERRSQDLFSRYRAMLPVTRAFAQERLAGLGGADGGGLALFGAGHQATMFATTLGVGHLIDRVVDDDPNKRGLLAPGFSVSVTPSAELIDSGTAGVCLLAVNPNSEPKVREKLAPLAARGARFYSIYADAPGSILEGRPWL